ncbi:MAG TPA: flippase-like domain-containing protein, partial [Actinomycetes bacterium]
MVAVRLGGWAARHAPIRRLFPSADQQHVVSATQRFSSRAHRILSASWFLPTGMPALAELLLDAASLYLFFLAVGYRSELGAILVAYAAANILAVIPVTPAGLGVIEANLVAVTVAYGAPVQLAVLAVLGYRVANFWLPLPIGLACSVH